MPILDEPNEIYHANAAIGSGNVRDALISPRLFKDSKEGLLKRGSAAMSFGTLAHLYFLEHDRWLREVAIKPDGMDGRTKEGKEWAAANAGMTIVSYDDATKLVLMSDRMPPEVVALLSDFSPELTVRVEALSGMTLQCRPDAWNRDANLVIDLKTTKDVGKIGQSVWQYGYHIQQAFYQHVIRCEMGLPPVFKFVFCETEAPYRWRIIELDSLLLSEGHEQMLKGLDIIQGCQRSGNWDDTGAVRQIVSLPRWMRPDEGPEDHE